MAPESRIAVYETPTLNQTIGCLASYMDTRWTHAKQLGFQKDFFADVHQWVLRPQHPSYFYQGRGTAGDKRQPSFIEAMRETNDRLRFVENFSRDFPQMVIGELLAGSLSYGRFYNVRGGIDASDIDLICVVEPEIFADEASLRQLFSLEKGFMKEQTEDFVRRGIAFFSLFMARRADFFYHKIPVGHFMFSVKIFPQNVFEWEYVGLLQRLLEKREDEAVAIRAYKPRTKTEIVSRQFNFFRDACLFPNTQERLWDGDAIASIPAAIFKDGTLFTGEHHNHVLPRTEVMYDPHGWMSRILGQYLAILRDEFEYEARTVDNGKEINVLNIMDRLPLFSQPIQREARARLAV